MVIHKSEYMIIDCISDLHGYYPELEGGDLLIVAGDLTARDTAIEHLEFVEWCRYLPYRKIVVIGGNHDNFIHKLKSKYFGMPVYHDHCEYICDSGTEFEIEEDIEEEHKFKGMISYKRKNKLKIWGSPWTKTFEGMNPNCKAFTCETEEELAEKWKLIPDDIDILVTHGPPYGILDVVRRYNCTGKSTENVGSFSLNSRLSDLSLKLHVFGHIHEAYGIKESNDKFYTWPNVNCSHVNEVYEPVNKPIRIELNV